MRPLKILFNAKKWIPKKDEWFSLLALISRDQIEHVYEYKFQKDLKFSLLSQIIIRHSLNMMLGVKWADIKIEKNIHGRPYYVNNNSSQIVDFNVSHNGDYLACVACVSPDKDFKIGVDIMQAIFDNDEKRYLRLSRIIKKYFSQDERNYVESKSSSNEKFKAAMRIWALKESYVKALGIGIGFDIRRINLRIDSNVQSLSEFIFDTQIQVDGEFVSACKFEEMFVDSHFITTCYLTEDNIENCEFKEIFIKDFLLPERTLSSISETDQDTFWNNFICKGYSNTRD